MTRTPGKVVGRHAVGTVVLALLACAGCGAPPPQASVAPLPAGHPAIGGAAPADGETVSGMVEVAPALRGQQPAKAVLFVVARRAGGREIVAVRREDSTRFPHAFVLSAGDAMTGDVPFSGVLDITARLSRSGDAIPASGDLEGVVRKVAVGRRGVTIVIDTVRP